VLELKDGENEAMTAKQVFFHFFRGFNQSFKDQEDEKLYQESRERK